MATFCMTKRNSQEFSGCVTGYRFPLWARVVKDPGNHNAAGCNRFFLGCGSSGKALTDISIFRHLSPTAFPSLAQTNLVIRSLEGKMSNRNALV